MTEVEEAKAQPQTVESEKAPSTPRSAGVPAARQGDAPPAATSQPKLPDAPVSIRSLATAPEVPPPPSLSRREREDLAKKRIGATVKGWRLARLLGTGPICAAY